MPFVFLLGGARSGKSSLAVRYAVAANKAGNGITYVVTAEGLDDEMRDRIASHRDERPPTWRTVEAPRTLDTVLADIGREVGGNNIGREVGGNNIGREVGGNDFDAAQCVVIDCVSMWVANLVMDGVPDVERRAKDLAATLCARSAPTFVVSNEVGMGLVPEYELGRRFRDVLGRVNAILAAQATESYLVVAGRTLRLSEPEV